MDTIFGPKILPQDSPAIPLLERNDTGRGVYISHLDRSPVSKKITLFVLVLLANIAFVAIMLWRASMIYNAALALVLNGFHHIETEVLRTMKKGFWSWCWMFMVAAFDHLLLRTFKLPTVVHKFITGHLWFRLRYGFQKTEVVFHGPTGKEFEKMLVLSTVKFQQALQMSVLQATNGQFVWGRTGFSTGHPHWELCYAASIDAHRLADEGVFDWKNWELSLWLKDRDQWTVREIWRHQDPLLCAKAIEIMKERLKTEGKDEYVARLENMQLAGVSSASLSDPATQELLHSLSKVEGFDMEERWAEAISEADRIRNQLPQLQ